MMEVGLTTKPPGELEPPPIADDPVSIEVLRVWAEPGAPQQFALRTAWRDPAAWGLLLADVARHAARAYASEGFVESQALDRILQALVAEVGSSTDEPLTLGN
jgi:hypothetical protein